MTLAKVWDGTQWKNVRALVGPQGPKGPQGVGAPPNGPAGGALGGNYPDPTISKVSAGGLLAVQRIWGQNSAYRTITTGQNFTIDSAGAVPLRISYTPSVPVWWEVEASMYFYKIDAAYNYGYAYLLLAPADADGMTTAGQSIQMQHNDVQTFVFRYCSHWYKLNAGIAYTCTLQCALSAGTWQFNQDPAHLWMSGKVFPQ